MESNQGIVGKNMASCIRHIDMVKKITLYNIDTRPETETSLYVANLPMYSSKLL